MGSLLFPPRKAATGSTERKASGGKCNRVSQGAVNASSRGILYGPAGNDGVK